MTMTLGERLKERRLELGWTLEEVAHYARTGKGHLHDIENGRTSKPSFEVISYIAAKLGVSLDELSDHV